MRHILLAPLFATLLASTAWADEEAFPAAKDDVVLTLGGGGRVSPEWDGSKHYVLSPMPIIGLKFLRSPFTGQPSSDTGFGIAPSFRYLDKRNFDSTSKLYGLPDVAASFEAGLTVDYTDTNYRAFATVRQGMGGHHGQLFDLGVDGILHPMDKLKIEAGPRLSFATADYMRAYFGVTDATAASSGVAAYKIGGGYRGAGLNAVATWDFDKHWFARADAGWLHLSDDIAKSPIVKAEGTRDQFTFGVGVAYRFGTGWH